MESLSAQHQPYTHHDTYDTPSMPLYTPLASQHSATSSSYFPGWILIVVVILGLYWSVAFGNQYYQSYKHRQSILERRRRAGIPDEDSRPFDIAYSSAALRRRQDSERKQQMEEEENLREQQQNTEWARLGRRVNAQPPLTNRAGNERYEGLTHRQPSRQPQILPVSYGAQYTDYRRTMSGSSSVSGNFEFQLSSGSALNIGNNYQHSTIATASSVPTWQDQYAPPEIKAAHERERKLVEKQTLKNNTKSTLGRRSRRQLDLDDHGDDDNGIEQIHQPSRSRRRLDTWAEKENQDLSHLKTRKRGDELDDEEVENAPSKSKRRVDSMPGGFQTQTQSATTTSASNKRKTREDYEEDDGENSVDEPESNTLPVSKPLKSKKRVRIVSRLNSGTDLLDQADGMDVESPRKPGEEWLEGGIKYKVDGNGRRLREAYVKEQHESLRSSNRYSPGKTTVYSVTKRWLTDTEFVQAERSGNITSEFDADTILAEIKQNSRAGSEAGSDWGSVVGQTPLKTGGLKTRLGSDVPAPPVPSLLASGRLPIEQARLTHLASPVRKNVRGTAGGVGLGKNGQWERKKAEAEALTALREARSKSKASTPNVVASTELPKAEPAKVVIPSVVLTVPTPTNSSEFKTPDVSTTIQSATTPASTDDSSRPTSAPVLPVFSMPSTTTTNTEKPKPVEAKAAVSFFPPTISKEPTKVESAPTKPVFTGFGSLQPSIPTTSSIGAPLTTSTPPASAPIPNMFPAFNVSTPSVSTPFTTTTPNTVVPAPEAPKPAFSFNPTPTIQVTKPTENITPIAVKPIEAPTPSTSPFGNPSATTTNFFGTNKTNADSNNSSTTVALSPFGAATAPTTLTAPKPSFGFGSMNNGGGFGSFGNSKPTVSFGASSNGQTSNPFFGGGAVATPPAGMETKMNDGISIRGAANSDTSKQPEAPKPAPLFGTSSSIGFGKPPASSSAGFGFNSNANSSAFGGTKPSTPTFGGFGAPASSTSAPAPTSATFGGFGISGSSSGAQNSVFGAPPAVDSNAFKFGALTPGGGTGTPTATTPTVPVFNLGATPPPSSRSTKPLPRARR